MPRDAMRPSSFSFDESAPTEIYTLSLHDALPISAYLDRAKRQLSVSAASLTDFEVYQPTFNRTRPQAFRWTAGRSEEHTSELQSRLHLVCRLLLEKKKSTNEEGHNAAHDLDTVRV